MKIQMRLSFVAFTFITAVGLSAVLMGFISYLVIDIGTQPPRSEIIHQTGQPQPEWPGAATSPDFNDQVTFISPEQAQTLVETSTGAVVHKVELEQKRGIMVYEVEAGRYEVYVDAVTGQILYQAVR